MNITFKQGLLYGCSFQSFLMKSSTCFFLTVCRLSMKRGGEELYRIREANCGWNGGGGGMVGGKIKKPPEPLPHQPGREWWGGGG